MKSEELLNTAALWWNDTKLSVEDFLGVGHDAIHLIVGFVALLAAAVVLRKPVSNWYPWFAVLLLALANELTDLWVERWPSAAIQYGEGFKDVLLTMLLPTVLLILSWTSPNLFEPKKSGLESG